MALITGASSGLGAEFARIHAAKGCDVDLAARRMAKLAALKKEIEGRQKIKAAATLKDLSTPNPVSKSACRVQT